MLVKQKVKLMLACFMIEIIQKGTFVFHYEFRRVFSLSEGITSKYMFMTRFFDSERERERERERVREREKQSANAQS